MRYTEIENLNEGFIQNVLGKIKSMYTKVKSIVSQLSKFNFKKFAADNKAAIKPIADQMLKAILSGEKVDMAMVESKLQPIASSSSALQMPTNEAVLNEDVRGAVEKMFAELAAVFIGFVSILQADDVITKFQAYQADPSAMNNYLLHGTSACMLYLLTGLAACLALRWQFKNAEKQRHELEDRAAERQARRNASMAK